MIALHYQLLIVGGGSAGLTAGLYAARARITTLLIEKAALGGQVLITDRVENYPGFADSISGYDLMDKMAAHANRFGLEKKLRYQNTLYQKEPAISHSHITLDERLPESLLSFLTRLPPVHLQLRTESVPAGRNRRGRQLGRNALKAAPGQAARHRERLAAALH